MLNVGKKNLGIPSMWELYRASKQNTQNAQTAQTAPSVNSSTQTHPLNVPYKGNQIRTDKFMGNTNQMYEAFQKNGMQLTNNGQKSAPSIRPTTQSDWLKEMYADISSSGGGGFSYKPLSHIGAFQPSQAYLDAMNYTNGLLDKINSGRTSYSDKVDELMGKIENRDRFKYDFNNDPLFQSQLASSMKSGRTAMADTIGQASALTGGYGSSYATSAGNQAYNGYVQQAYDRLPEFYNMALNEYQMEGNELYNQLGMYQTADNTEYSRLFDAYNSNYQKANDMYGREYSNYWDTANYNLGVDQANNEYAYKNASLAASQRKQKLSEIENMYKLMNGDSTSSSKSGSDVVYKEPSSSEYTKALNAFDTGGWDEFYKIIDTFGSDVDVDALVDYVSGYGNSPASTREYEKTGKDTINWMGGIDNNDRVKDEYGNEYTLKQLYNLLIEQGMTEKEAKDYVKKYN